MKDQIRIDKWLWAVRIYKTRTRATEACVGGKVKIGGAKVKASYKIKPEEMIQVRKGVVQYTYRVLQTAEKRMGPKHIKEFLKDLTPYSEIRKLNSPTNNQFNYREKGQGRPTKKERRSMDKFNNKY